jgi:hypothetical protein
MYSISSNTITVIKWEERKGGRLVTFKGDVEIA